MSLYPRKPSLIQTAFAIALAHAVPLCAQWIPCLPEQQDVPTIPELISQGGKLHATIVLSDEQQRLTFRQPPSTKPSDSAPVQCAPQYVRVFKGIDAVPPLPPKTGDYPDPMPGPTLRARVGDLVQLTFVNQINPADFGDSIDRGDRDTGTGCDETSVYPGKDTYPDCFHGSSTANIHFHGTHTNPNSTGDNVFLEIRPSLRVDGKPVVTPESVKASFDQFFAQCSEKLKNDVLSQWPTIWSDLPSTYTTEQKKLLQKYDQTPGIKKLWPVNAAQLKKCLWPQYYVGAYPYCFRLPEYTDASYPPAQPAGHAAMHTGGPSTEDRPEPAPSRALMMGQAPGTHWYHAHKHGSTAIDVANGMTGAFIIEGKYDDELNKFYGEGWTRKQRVLVINQLGVSPNLERGKAGRTDKGPDFSVNGRLRPVVQMRPGEVQMWRIVNTSGRAGALFLAPTNLQWRQLAQDGVQFKDVNYQQTSNVSFLMMAGNRVDLLVKAPATAGKYPVVVKNIVDPTDLTATPPPNPLTLLTVNVSGTGPEMQFITTAPSFPPFLADIAASDVKGTKRIVYATGPTFGSHTIDGKKFDGEVGAVVLLNTVEEWKVVNATYGPLISHPFHIHINPFQVVEVFDPKVTITDPATGKSVPKYVMDKAGMISGQCYLDPNTPDDWKPCDGGPAPKDLIWWDVFPIPSGATLTAPGGKSVNVPGYFKMRSRFVDYSGYYVTHCHILAHEDRGMMTVVEVAPLTSPYSHD